ncbi:MULTISPECIES: hypothetical protein [unclassified Bosea (in: a-proteobacteria)]|uniref:hypothetical protein n=1 Tax=unclassified Bosea (in: a-proteobacteria) TaxID=2653178 RepID=UPI00125F376D|nr:MULTISPECIES: hypothetical protein [unclassified Bosea (in: a-proteobacteria)]
MKLFLSAVAFCAATAILFGDPSHALALATIWSDRLGLPYWRMIALLCMAASALIFATPLRTRISPVLRLPVFTILAVLLPTAIVGVYADSVRHRSVLAFGAEEVEEHSFFASIREAPAEFQFFLHTVALKNCVPYAWSYRTLSFYELRPNVAVNVLQQRSITKCGITRTERR